MPRSKDERTKILIVEDHEDMRDLLRMQFEAAQFDVLVAAGGYEGFAMAQREPPDVVLSDLEMPGGSGTTLLELLKAWRPDLPVFILTAQRRVRDSEPTLERADAILEKPMQGKILIDTVRNYLLVRSKI